MIEPRCLIRSYGSTGSFPDDFVDLEKWFRQPQRRVRPPDGSHFAESDFLLAAHGRSNSAKNRTHVNEPFRILTRGGRAGACRPELLREYWIWKGVSTLAQLERNVTMWDKVVQFRRQAQDCKDRAAGARDPIDEDAWLKLAEEWLALASANEAARNLQNPPAVNAHPASE